MTIPALLYVDPASSSLLMQIIAPVFVFLSMVGLHFRSALVALWKRLFKRDSVRGAQTEKPQD